MPAYPISKHPLWNYLLNLMADPSVSEIETNGPNEFFTRRNGMREQITGFPIMTGKEYSDSLAAGLVPLVDTHLPFDPYAYIFEGPLRYKAGEQNIRGRCHIVLPPAVDYPVVTIAKKSTSLTTLDSIAQKGSMASEMLTFVKMAVDADLTMVISGGTGAGKTTFLEAITKLIPMNTRIGVAEDTPELELIQPNVIYQHSVPWRPGMEEKDVATLSWVVAQIQRQRTDRTIIGETRGKEFADFLVAANSGQDGSLTTLHADTPVRAVEKMAKFAMKAASNEPLRTINQDIATSIDIVIQLAYIKGTSRYRVTAIEEITDVVSPQASADITTNRLYTYNSATDTWEKISQITDSLRTKFSLKGVDFSPLMKSAPNAILQPIGGTGGGAMRTANPLAQGLPKSPFATGRG